MASRGGRHDLNSPKGVVLLVGGCIVIFTLMSVFSGCVYSPPHNPHDCVRGSGSNNGPPSLPGREYAVVFDAGSSGSRVHVFQFIPAQHGQHELEIEYFEQLKPGLSSYGQEASAAADSLTPLLEFATSKVLHVGASE